MTASPSTHRATDSREATGLSAPRLVLASGSASRLRVLRTAGIYAEALPSGVPEDVDGADTEAAVTVVAERKARAVATRCPGALVLGCDSLLDVDGSALGKPASARDAVRMWRLLVGRQAVLYTGHCLMDTRTGNSAVEVARTVVRFGSPGEAEIAAYVSSGEPTAMAGGFSIEGLAAPFVDGVDGDVSNVLGVSLPLLRRMLNDFGVPITCLWLRPPGPAVRELADADRGWLADLVAACWGLPVVSVSGTHDPVRLPGLLAEADGERLGALTYRRSAEGFEVITLNSLTEDRGVGSALLAEARRRAAAAGARLWLITTNENVRSIGFYQRRGMQMVALHRDFADTVRRIKPGAVMTRDGIAFRHAIEFEYPAHDQDATG